MLERAGLEGLDERGLMPPEDERATLAGAVALGGGTRTTASSKGTGRWRRWSVWRTLSLADAAEFVAMVVPLRWDRPLWADAFDAIGERYGDGALPWVESRIRDDSVLDDPMLGITSLLWRSRSPEAFDLAARISEISSVLPWLPEPDEPGALATRILDRPEAGSALLTRRLLTGGEASPLLANAVRTLYLADPRGTRQRIRAGLDPAGAARLDSLLDRLGLVERPLPEAVRAALDAAPVAALPPSLPGAIEQYDWYTEQERHSLCWIDFEVFCAAMRLTAYVTPGGTDGLVFECLVVYRPSGPDDTQYIAADLHRFGFGLAPGAASAPFPHRAGQAGSCRARRRRRPAAGAPR